jgi:quercetin dioxygenase-like cupin family protein
MRAGALIVAVLGCLAAGAAGLGQMSTGQSAVEMTGMKSAIKLQSPVEGFLTPINGKLDMRATEVEFEPGDGVRDHYHFGPGIRRVLAGELTLVYADTKKEQVVHAGEYFYEPGDIDIWTSNRGAEPAKLLIVELVPANLKSSAMVPLARRAELVESGSRLKKVICSAK